MARLTTGIDIPRFEIQAQTGEDRDRVLRYIAPSPDLVSRTKLLLRSMLVVGPMGYGKTSFTEAKLGDAVKRLLDHGVDEGEIGYIYAQEEPLTSVLDRATRWGELPRLRYLFLFIDDAPAAQGLHGRRAMARENVVESQAITMIRHRLKRAGYEGYIFVAWASQVYHLVDITVRRTSALKIFKDYPEEDDMKLVGRMLGSAGMQALAILAEWLSSDNPERFLLSVYSGVAKMKKRRWLITAFDCPGFPECRMPMKEIERQVEEKKAILYRARTPPPAEADGGEEEKDREECAREVISSVMAKDYVIERLLSMVDVKSKGADVMIKIKGDGRIWLRKSILEAARKTPDCLSQLLAPGAQH